MSAFPIMYSMEARTASFRKAAPPATTKGKKQKAAQPKGGWPHPDTFLATPRSLSLAGFFYTDKTEPDASSYVDEVECFMCKRTLGGWEAEDDPHREHASRIKQTKCAWAMAVCSIQAEKISPSEWRFTSSDRLPSAKALEKARKTTFAPYWPHEQHKSISSKKMAEAGFVYTPMESAPDMTTCPYCHTSFDDWGAGDDPLALHKRKKPECPVFTAEVYDPNKAVVAEEDAEESGSIAPAPKARKAPSRKTSTRKTSAAPAATKGKRLTKAPKDAPVVEEESQADAEPEPEPEIPKKKRSKAKASTTATSNSLSKSTRGKKPPPEPEPDSDAVDENASDDFDANPGSGSRTTLTRKRSQAATDAVVQTLSRNPEKLRPDGVTPRPPSGSAGLRQSSRVVSGAKGKRGAQKVEAETESDAPTAAKVSRKKKAAPPPSPEDQEEEEVEEASQPTKTKTKAKPKAKSKAKKTEVIEVEEDEPPAPTGTSSSSVPKKGRSRSKSIRKTAVVKEAETPMEEETEEVPVKVKKTSGKKTAKQKEEPAPDDAMETSADEHVEAESLPPPPPKPAAKAKKASKAAVKKAKQTPPAPEPEPEPEEATPSDSDHVMEADIPSADEEEVAAQVSEPADSSDSAIEGSDADVTDHDEVEETDPSNLPAMDTASIHSASGPTEAPSLKTARNAILRESQANQQTPRAADAKSERIISPLPTHRHSRTPKQPPPLPTAVATPVKSSPQQKQPLRTTPSALAAISNKAVVTFTAEERAMTLKEYVEHKMNQEYAKLKLDGERDIAEFEERGRQVRKTIEEM